MSHYLKRCWAVVNLDNIAHNMDAIKKTMHPGCRFMGVVKADAYGHGDLQIAKELVRLGADWLGVSNLDEAVRLRENGIELPILVFGVTPPEEAGRIAGYNVTQTVHTLSYAKTLDDACAMAGGRINIHIKVDTGMGRLGFNSDETRDMLGVASCKSLDVDGIYTHFACADETGEDSQRYTKLQYTRFCGVISGLEASGLKFQIKHCCNSAAAMRYPEMHMDMVRPGIALYGLYPGEDRAGLMELKPAMTWYSQVTMVKEIEAGEAVSYGRTFTAAEKTKAATVGTGYADGYPRSLSNMGKMLVRGRYAEVIGRVCMDQLILDVTHIDGVSEGDLVTIIGTDGLNSVTLDEIAEATGTINYERACLIGKRVPRVYTRGGFEVTANCSSQAHAYAPAEI